MRISPLDMRGETPREIWIKRVDRWRSSDLTAKEFAAEIGVKYQTLQHWKYRLNKEQRQASETAPQKQRKNGREPRSRHTQPISFVEVPTKAVAAPTIEIEFISGTRLRIPLDIEPRMLAGLLEVLEARV